MNIQDAVLTQAPLFISNEALPPHYEDTMTLVDTTTHALCNAGAHLVRLGDRT